MAAPPCTPLPDTQVTKAHPNSPSRPTSLIPEVRNPAHSPNPDSPEILVSPVPVPEGSTTSPVSNPAASIQGRTSDTTLVPNPKPNPAETAGVDDQQGSRNHLQNLICECSLTHSIRDSISKDNHNSWLSYCRLHEIHHVELYWASWATTFVRGSVAFVKGEGSVMYKSLRASKSNYVKRLCLVVPLVSRP